MSCSRKYIKAYNNQSINLIPSQMYCEREYVVIGFCSILKDSIDSVVLYWWIVTHKRITFIDVHCMLYCVWLCVWPVKMQFMIIHFKNLFWFCVWSRLEVQCKMHRHRVSLVFTNWYFWWTWLQACFLMLLCNGVRLFNFLWENLIERNYAIVSLCSPCCVFQDQVVSCHLTDVQSRVPFAAFNVVFTAIEPVFIGLHVYGDGHRMNFSAKWALCGPTL